MNHIKKRVLIIIASLLVMDTFLLAPFSSIYNLGIILPGIVGIIIFLYVINKKNRFVVIENKYFKNVIYILLGVWLISFLGVELFLITESNTEYPEKIDYLMILGAGVHGDEMSLSLKKRMQTGLEYLEENPEIKVIVSGGQGQGENISEADAMSSFLLNNGIAKDRILTENKSTSTLENFEYSKMILPPQRNKISILIITNDFHMFRAKLLAERCGFVAYGLPCRTPLPVLPNCYLREYFAVLKSIVIDRP